ncbi:hypothetical protein LWI28_018031 [Acer negundo]|uniref:RNase H type-1 domain-containing protein n=1 Tax=Acer negundo TaxID=4023 RepID=A0AAD5NUZ5_ACENE|nr:hypothetical protein LWI28_018031 [Acer negundo]
MDDFLILHCFGLQGRPSKALVIKSVIWSPPAPGWIKVNTDGAAMGSPGVGGCGGIFQNCRAFVNGCFAIPLGQVFAFEAEFLTASSAINFAWKYGWHRIWLESDSFYVGKLLSSRSEMVPWKVHRRSSAASSRSCRWIFRFPIFLGKGIRLQIRFLSMLWSFKLFLGGSLPRRSVLL